MKLFSFTTTLCSALHSGSMTADVLTRRDIAAHAALPEVPDGVLAGGSDFDSSGFLLVLRNLWAREDDDGGLPKNFMHKCQEHAKKLSAKIGRSYTDLHPQSDSDTECWFDLMYSDTLGNGFASHLGCKEFANKLWNAHEDELRTNSTEGYAKLCWDLYRQRSHKGSKLLTPAMRPKRWTPSSLWLAIFFLLLVGLIAMFFVLMRHHPTQTLCVEVSSAKGLRVATDSLDSRAGDPYCILEILGKPSSRTSTKVIKHNGTQTELNEQLELKGYNRGDTLEFTIMEHGPEKNDLLASVLLHGSRFHFTGFDGELQLMDLSSEGGKSISRPKAAGTLHVRIPPPDAKWGQMKNEAN